MDLRWQRVCEILVFTFCVGAPNAFAQEKPSRDKGVQGQVGGSRLGNYEKPPPANDIPDHPYDVLLGRPTDTSIELRILQYSDGQGSVRYRPEDQATWKTTPEIAVVNGQPQSVVIESLKPDTKYIYQWIFKGTKGSDSLESSEHSFRTARLPGSSFAFSVTADSHLDENSSGTVYTRTLLNALASSPDFHLELGDTFMTGKYVRPEISYPQYLAQRYYLSHLCSSAPLFFVIGNHDGESAGRGSMTWATTTRKSFFPNPTPNAFYTGNTQKEADIGLPENYYAWMWGDAQFIVLDPYRYTTSKRRGGGGQRGGQRGGKSGPSNSTNDTVDSSINDASGMNNWYWTLGEEQYQWLKQELKKPAKYRFVFIHHLVGGTIQNQRGGAEVATMWEWGGKNLEGKYEFDTYRKNWGKPIHQLLVDARVSVVFHGHDHFFAKQELDGIVYQEVPQPSHARVGNTRSAAEYGYLMGDFQPSSGYVRVRVESDQVRVDYVRTFVGERDAQRNGEVSYSYVVTPNTSK